MVLKSQLEEAYLLQKKELARKRVLVERNYLQHLDGGGSHVEVISGIRRCGKSTLMRQMMKELNEDFAFFNFEDPRAFDFELSDFLKLDTIIGENVGIYFFDEIQNVLNWEVYVRQLHDRGKKVFITGSNASLLSKELGTRLTGRHLRHELFPFSYLEFLNYKKLKDSVANFEKYREQGGFPEYLRDGNFEMLQTLFKDIVLRDIAVRHGVKNTQTLMDISLFLISNIAKPHTFNSLRKSFSVGSPSTVSDYLAWLEDSYLLFFLQKFSWSAKKMAVNPRKVYTIDNGLANANSLSFTEDKGRLLENMVFLHLRQHFSKLYYFNEKRECDFVVFEKEKCQYLIQVCEKLDGDNLRRETDGLREAMRFFDKKDGLVLTMNQSDELRYEEGKIEVVSAREFITKS